MGFSSPETPDTVVITGEAGVKLLADFPEVAKHLVDSRISAPGSVVDTIADIRSLKLVMGKAVDGFPGVPLKSVVAQYTNGTITLTFSTRFRNGTEEASFYSLIKIEPFVQTGSSIEAPYYSGDQWEQSDPIYKEWKDLSDRCRQSSQVS